MKLILHHAQGNANVRASANALAEAELLAQFHTSIACFDGSLLDSMTVFGFLSEFRRRRFDTTLKPFTHTSPLIELGRLLSLKAGVSQLTKQEKGIFCIEASIRNIDKKVASVLHDSIRNGVEGVYAYEDGAYYSFKKAAQLGLDCFYDLPTGYWRAKLRILDEEKQRMPEWRSTIRGLFDSKEKLERKDEEIRMADKIFVASKFTALTLNDFPGTLPPVEVIPYGFPGVAPVKIFEGKSTELPIKLLFVGSVSQQKGIAYLFEAVKQLGDNVMLTIVGRKTANDCEALNNNLRKHTWIPSLPHNEILQIMRQHDVLVFPTLFDGFGLVITEAMSQGTPVIATYNCAGPDLIEHGKNGWLVEAGSTVSLKAVLEELIDNPSIIKRASIAAIETARQRPWSVFKKELSAAIIKHQDKN